MMYKCVFNLNVIGGIRITDTYSKMLLLYTNIFQSHFYLDFTNLRITIHYIVQCCIIHNCNKFKTTTVEASFYRHDEKPVNNIQYTYI